MPLRYIEDMLHNLFNYDQLYTVYKPLLRTRQESWLIHASQSSSQKPAERPTFCAKGRAKSEWPTSSKASAASWPPYCKSTCSHCTEKTQNMSWLNMVENCSQACSPHPTYQGGNWVGKELDRFPLLSPICRYHVPTID